jgi:hypothetical protein
MLWTSLACSGKPDVLELACQEAIWHAWASLMPWNWHAKRQSGVPGVCGLPGCQSWVLNQGCNQRVGAT